MVPLQRLWRLCGEGPISNFILTVLLVIAALALVQDSVAPLGLAFARVSAVAAVLLVAVWMLLRATWSFREQLRGDACLDWLRAHDAGIVMAALLIAGLALRLWGIDFGDPLVVHPDEPVVAGRALGMLKQGWIDPPEPYFYPTVFQYLLLPAFGLHYVQGLSTGTWTDLRDVSGLEFSFYLVARVHSAILGTLTILLVYLIARRLWPTARGRWAGVAAAAFLTFSFNHVRWSHFAVTDAAMTFFVMLAFLAIISVLHIGSMRSYLVAGFLVGIACATKYNALPIVFVFVAAHFLARPLTASATPRFLAGLAAIPGGFFVGYPYALLNWPPFLDHLGKLGRFTGAMSFDPGDRFRYIVGYAMESGLGAAFTVALAAALLFALHRRRAEELLCTALIVATMVVLAHSSHRFFPRYLLPLIPASTLLVGHLLVEMATFAQRVRGLGNRRWLVPSAAVVLVALIIWPQAAESVAFSRERALPDTRAQAAVYLERRFDAGAVVASEARYLRLDRDYTLLRWTPLESMRYQAFVRENVNAVVFSSARDSSSASTKRAALRRRFTLLREFTSADGTARGPTISVYLHDERQ